MRRMEGECVEGGEWSASRCFGVVLAKGSILSSVLWRLKLLLLYGGREYLRRRKKTRGQRSGKENTWSVEKGIVFRFRDLVSAWLCFSWRFCSLVLLV